ncbi:hypothetical protein BGX21_009879 [Mortierella sp. AD011]|nr:hypothetical protein BGX20_006502 [Mortierella sp. AD010]KAF9395489.1 hypothetical protein BGX21_009879 [Mortierella sp. AD011]
MEDLSDGCYCSQELACPHWIAAKMDSRLTTAKEHSHTRAKTFERELLQEDHRPVVSELQRELRSAMLEIEKLAKTSRDLAKVNQELEESRLLAVSDQARTAKRLILVSSQLEHTEQQLFDLTKEVNIGRRDSELLRIERIKREALQEREDAGRLKIEALQDELQEVQRSERGIQQKLTAIQNKYESLSKRHDNLKKQQQELELARESKEALAWLKETTDRLCSPPQGGLGQAIQQERSSLGSGAISIHRSSPSSSPPYPSSFIDPPLAAQNQLISLIKELATTNSTLRSELNEYRDLLQDTRNEMLALRSQVEDYEQGHAFANCCGGRMDDGESFRTSRSAWSTLDVPAGGGLDAVSHIGTLGSIPGSPPPYMTTPKASSRHRSRHHSHTSGVRGSVFGELERLYSQSHQDSSAPVASKRHGRDDSRKNKQRALNVDEIAAPTQGDSLATTVSTSASTSEAERGSTSAMSSARSPVNPTPSKLLDQYDLDKSSPTSTTSRSRRSMSMDAELYIPGSSTNPDEDNVRRHQGVDSFNPLSDAADSKEDQNELVDRFAETNQISAVDLSGTKTTSQTLQPPIALLPPANLDGAGYGATETFDSGDRDNLDSRPESPFKSRASPISLLSAELQRATRSESKNDSPSGGDTAIMHLEHKLHPLAERSSASSDFDQGATMNEDIRDYSPRAHHEKSYSEQGVLNERQRRRLSEPLSHQPSLNSLSAKNNRPSSIYSLRRPRPRVDSPNFHCIHSAHATSASVGSIPELQRCKSAELVEQIIAEQRHRTMEAWRVGVVAAAVTQQQSIHSIVAFGEHRRDMDNISIRSKASRRRGKGPTVTERVELNTVDVSDPIGHSLPSKDLERAIRETQPSEEYTLAKEEEGEVGVVQSTHDPAVSTDSGSHLIVDATLANSDTVLAPEISKTSQDKAVKDKKRRSVRSMRSIRSSLLRSPMVRSPPQARDRRFPSEASTASEAFSNRRYDHGHSPYQLLHTLSMDLLERLTRSDTRELNRRLRRTFDIQALSQMSNSVIENVLTDVSNLGERFRWLEEQIADPIDEMLDHQPMDALSGGEDGLESEQDDIDEDSLNDQGEEDWGFSVAEFFPLANTVQEMLSEIGKLRMTINELQLSYVLKVEQDRIRAERDFLQDVSSSEDEEDYDTPIMDPRLNRAPEKPTQPKNALGRPRILGSASTGVSGFFNKVFGGNSQPPLEDANSSGSRQPTTNVEEAPKDKPSISKSKSGIVVAETSRVVADSPWISSPSIPVGPKTGSQATVAEPPRRSGTGSIAIPGSRLSATTSLAAMATMSPARSTTVHVTEGLATAHMASSSRTRPIDISFSEETKQDGTRRSPLTTSPAVVSAQGMLSRSLPKNQSIGLQPSEADTAEKFARSEQTPASVSYHSTTITFEEAKSPHTPATEPSNLDLSNATSSRSPGPGQRPLSMNKTPRSIGISTRTGGPAMNVVTKQDVFHEHYTSSTPSSSFSATVSTVPSRATSERRATMDSISEGATLPDAQKASSSMASLSSNSGASEISAALKPAAKPTLITRSALTVATPSTSSMSSPMSTTSWLDNRRYSGSQAPDMSLDGESKLSENSVTLLAPVAEAPIEPRPATGFPGGVVEHQLLRKPRASTMVHTDAAPVDSNDSTTRSLGRAGGRESALAFLRGEMQVSSILGSLFQSQSTNQGQSPGGSPSLSRSNSTRALKGKQPASEIQTENAKTSVEVLTDGFEDGEEVGTQGGGIEGSDMHQVIAQNSTLPRLDSSSSNFGPVSTPTTSLSQKAAVTSTAVAYVVATPDVQGNDDKDRKRRAVFDRELIKASQKRILAGIPPQDKPFVPQAGPRRARALSVDSAQSTEPLKANEIMDLWRVGAGVSRDIWRGLIKKVDGRDS